MADAPIVIKGGHARLRFLLLVAVFLRTASRSKPCQLADHQVCLMNGNGATATKVPQRLLHSCLHAPYLCHAAALSLCSVA